jgi:hypothetical protein
VFALLPALSLLLQSAVFFFRRPEAGAREAFLKAAVIVGLIASAFAELLSWGRHLSFGPLAAAWSAVLLTQALSAAALGGAQSLDAWRGWFARKIGRLKDLGRDDALALAAVLATVLVCGLVAWLCPPRQWARTYMDCVVGEV